MYVYIGIILNTKGIMVQSTFSIELDEDIKTEMNEICDSLGMNMSTAFSVFARAFVRNRGFPFELRLPMEDGPLDGFLRARRELMSRYLVEPSLDEINEEIRAVRESRKL